MRQPSARPQVREERHTATCMVQQASPSTRLALKIGASLPGVRQPRCNHPVAAVAWWPQPTSQTSAQPHCQPGHSRMTCCLLLHPLSFCCCYRCLRSVPSDHVSQEAPHNPNQLGRMPAPNPNPTGLAKPQPQPTLLNPSLSRRIASPSCQCPMATTSPPSHPPTHPQPTPTSARLPGLLALVQR